MANKQIYQLTEALSVSNDDWLAIDLDASNVTRKVRVGNVFTATPAGSDTQIQFNDGGSFGASSNLTYTSTGLSINRSDGGFFAGGGEPSLFLGGTTYGRGGLVMWGNTGLSQGTAIWQTTSNLRFGYTSDSGTSGSIKVGWDMSLGQYGFNQASPLAVIHATSLTNQVGYRLDLSNGQTSDAFQINSYGNTGGDVFRIDYNGKLTIRGQGSAIGFTSGQYIDSAVGTLRFILNGGNISTGASIYGKTHQYQTHLENYQIPHP